jgi:hypothetical protein
MILFTSLTLLSFLANTLAFHHPGLLVTNEDLSRAKTKVAAEEDPWLSSWNKLISLDLSQTSWRARPVRTVSRGTNGELLWQDAAAAFNLAIRWKISGDDQYADAASGVLVSWASTLQSLSGGGDDDYLTAGLQGYQLANAAELLRDYLPFAENDFSAIKSMLTTIFLPMNLDFLNHRLGSTHIHKHFFANWEQANLACVMAIGVLTENSTTWDFALDYFKTGSGNGGIYNGITNIVREPGTGKPLGQGQESGRDQGHSSLNFQLLGVIGQQAWNQDVDLFSFADSRILLGFVYSRYVPIDLLTCGHLELNILPDITLATMFLLNHIQTLL